MISKYKELPAKVAEVGSYPNARLHGHARGGPVGLGEGEGEGEGEGAGAARITQVN